MKLPKSFEELKEIVETIRDAEDIHGIDMERIEDYEWDVDEPLVVVDVSLTMAAHRLIRFYDEFMVYFEKYNPNQIEFKVSRKED